MAKTIKTGRLFRTFEFDRAAVDKEGRTVPLSFSSESPVERWFGMEILDHSENSIRMGRLKKGGPVLMDHNTEDQIGVVEDASIGPDRKGRAVVRFGKSARADEIFNDVLDGIRRNVSVGYQIHSMVLEEETDKVATYRATDWEPLEISIVSVPADTTVGVGRGEGSEHEIRVTEKEKKECRMYDMATGSCSSMGGEGCACGACPMSENAMAMPTGGGGCTQMAAEQCACSGCPESSNQTSGGRSMPEKEEKKEVPVDVNKIRTEEREAERHRQREINAIAEKHPKLKDLARQFIDNGRPLDEFRQVAFEKITNAVPVPSSAAEIGLTDKEARSFSFIRAINAMASPNDQKAQEAAKFERECSDAVGKKFGKSAQGIFVPMEVQKRDLTSGTATTGGNTVATDLLAGSFIDLLRNRLITRQMGATVLTGLQGNVAIPRQSSGATAYWVAENVAPTESEPAFDQVTMSPKTVGTFTDISRKLLIQSSSDVEGLVRNDLARVMALEIDRAGINGAGTGGEPKGVLKQSSIGDVAGGTNGAAPTWANMISLWSTTAVANADFGSTGYLTNAKVVGKLMQTLKGSSTMDFIMTAFPDANGMTNLAGARCGVSNQVPSNLTKGTSSGVCSAIIFGNWADLLIGQWGALDILVDPYTGSAAGTTRVRVLQDVDIAVRHAASFTAMQDALTT